MNKLLSTAVVSVAFIGGTLFLSTVEAQAANIRNNSNGVETVIFQPPLIL